MAAKLAREQPFKPELRARYGLDRTRNLRSLSALPVSKAGKERVPAMPADLRVMPLDRVLRRLQQWCHSFWGRSEQRAAGDAATLETNRVDVPKDQGMYTARVSFLDESVERWRAG